MYHPTRRAFLGTAGVAAAAGLAGYTGSGGRVATQAGVPGSEYPAIDRWLTETEVGGATDNYDGTLVDWTGRDAVTVEVGAEGNGGSFAYGPAGAVVSTGTEVRWSWTGRGNPHNVEAEPDEQLGVSDYAFSSGEPAGGSGVKYTRTLDGPGILLYHCEPHLALGMKGGIAVR